MPRAHDMPIELREATHPVPATSNKLGVKGTGEAGTTAAIAAVMNAISQRGAERRRRSHGNAGDAVEGLGSVPEGAYACEMNFVFIYACRPSMPPSEP